MKELVHGVGVVILLIVSSFNLFGEILSGFDDISAFAVENNVEYRTAEFEYMKALKNLEHPLRVDESDISLLTSYSGVESDILSSKFSATVPIINQLQFNASVNQNLDGNLGISFYPLYHSDSSEQADIAFNTAFVYLRELKLLTTVNSVAAVLEWTSAVRKFEILGELIRIKKNIYEDEKKRYELGNVHLDNVREALLNWSGARINLVAAQDGLQQAESELFSVLNASPNSIDIEMIGMNELAGALGKIKIFIRPDILSVEDTFSVLSSKYAVKSMKAKLDNTWLFEPDLGISAGLDYKMGSFLSAGASVTITVSVSDWQSTEISQLETELSLTQDIFAQSLATEKINLEHTLITLETTQINSDVAEIELEQAEELVEEAEFLYNLGDYSDTELEEVLLTLKQVENNLFSALTDEYNAWQSLRIYTLH